MLISIIVITYNSSRYVLETLESAYHQSYQEIELIVSDDCSTDATFSICQEWAESHKDRFTHIVCTQTPYNLGICGNCNHALTQATGVWVKYIGGDDCLKSNCIERFINNIHPNTFFYICDQEAFNDITKKIIFKYHTTIPYTSARKQLRYMLTIRYGFSGNTFFIKRHNLIYLHGFDTQFPMVEDYPIVMKFLTHNMNIHVISECLVTYRKHNDSVSSLGTHCKSLNDAIWYYAKKYCWRYGLIFHLYNYWLDHWIIVHSKQNKSFLILGYLLRSIDIVHIKRKISPIQRENVEYIS
jgi:alpha-1,3-rhamnosyltransferase